MSLLIWFKEQFVKTTYKIILFWLFSGLLIAVIVFRYDQSTWKLKAQAWSEEAVFHADSKSIKQLELHSIRFLIQYPSSSFNIYAKDRTLLWSYPLSQSDKSAHQLVFFNQDHGQYSFKIYSPPSAIYQRVFDFSILWMSAFLMLLMIIFFSNKKTLGVMRKEFDRLDQIDAPSWIKEISSIKENQRNLTHKNMQLESDAELGKNYSQIAHDLRGPVGALNILKNSSRLLADEKELLEMSSERIAEIANLVLIKRKALQLDQEMIYLKNQLLGEAFKRQKKVELDIRLDALANISHQDRIECFRHILNLALNSIEVIDCIGWLTISATQMDKSLEISVLDSGPGVPDDVVTRLKLALPIRSHKINGNGLALANVNRWLKSKGSSLVFERKRSHSSVSFILGNLSI